MKRFVACFTLASGTRFESASWDYSVTEKLGRRTVAAVARSKHSSEAAQVVVVCDKTSSGTIQRELANIQLASSIAPPQVHDGVFEVSGKSCLSLGRLAEDLPTYVEYVRFPMPEVTLGRIGRRMLTIVRTMHESGIGQREAYASRWVLREPSDIESMTMVGFTSMRTLDKDPHGYHRIIELQQLVVTLRFLQDFDPRWHSIKDITGDQIPVMCPSEAVCPPGLRALLEYVFSVNPHIGAVPQDMYQRIEAILETMVTAGRYSRFDLNTYIPPRIAETSIPDEVQVVRSGILQDGASNTLEFRYKMGLGTTGNVYDALTNDPRIRRGQFAVKCRVDVTKEVAVMERLQSAPWCPKLYGVFEYSTHNPPLQCIKQEKIHLNLQELAKPKEYLKIADLIQVGLAMIEVVESMHTIFGIVHGDLHAQNWAERANHRDLALFDYADATEVTDDPTGVKRISDLRQVVETLRHLFGIKIRSKSSSDTTPDETEFEYLLGRMTTLLSKIRIDGPAAGLRSAYSDIRTILRE